MTDAASTPRLGRVLIVLGTLDVGGAERQGLMLALRLAANPSNHVEVWGMRSAGTLIPLLEAHNLSWRCVRRGPIRNPIRQARLVCRLIALLRQATPDVIIPFGRMPNLLMAMLWRFSSAHVCIWNQRNNGADLAGSRLHRWAAARVPVLIANSREGADAIIEHLRVPESRVAVVNNGVEWPSPDIAPVSWRRQAGFDDDALLVCMVANLRPEKDHGLLLRAWASVVTHFVQQSIAPPVLLLAGADAGEGAKLHRLAEELAITSHVRFLGMVRDVPQLLQACDLAVFTSHGEGCPNGLLECMAAGLPVVATDLPGIRDALPKDSSACLVTPGDCDGLAEALTHLLRNTTMRREMGRRNRQQIEQHFSPQGMVQRIANLVQPYLPDHVRGDR